MNKPRMMTIVIVTPFVLLLAVGLLVRWQQDQRQAVKSREEASPPKFLGERAEPVKYDLIGTWKVFHYIEEGGASRKERWEALWTLKKLSHRMWADTNGQGHFDLCDASPGEQLKWSKADGSVVWFSINEQSFGLLNMTGDDGFRYMAIRTEGGE